MSTTAPLNIFLDLAARGQRFPIGTDLVLSEKADPEAIKHDGERLGQVVAESAARWDSPIAVPLMDLTVEKEWLLGGLGIPAAEIPTYHFHDAVPDIMPDVPLTPRIKANAEAIRYIATQTDLFACGMSIGPFSLMTKLIADPITPVFTTGMGESDEETECVEKALALGTQTILRGISAQLDAGAKAIILCEPAANMTYFSPHQLADGSDVFERYVMEFNKCVSALLKSRGAALIFHDCGELIESMVKSFVALEPAMFSFGSSRLLWEDAKLVPEHIVLYGNLPTKKFYSDDVLPLAEVQALSKNLIAKMRKTGHPFILGSECDVLNVPGSEERIRAKVDAFLKA